MTVGEFKVAIQPAMREILTSEELAATSVRVTERSAPLSSLDDQEMLSASTQLHVFTLGESAVIWVDGSETAGEVYAKVRNDLQDFVAESSSAGASCAPSSASSPSQTPARDTAHVI